MEALQFHARPVLRRPVLVLAFAGWNDAGQAASTAVRFLADQCNAQPYVSLDPEEFYDFTVNRPHVRLTPAAQRMVEWITFDCVSAVLESAEHDFILGWGPEPHLRWRSFCAAILDLARQCGAEMIVTMGGFLAELLYSDPVPVTGFATPPELIERFAITTTRYEGPTGIVGALGAACRTAGLPHVSLWAALPHYIAAIPNPRGALALLLRLVEVLNFPVDLGPLQTAAAQFEQNVEDAIAKDAKLTAYVRELKKRELAN